MAWLASLLLIFADCRRAEAQSLRSSAEGWGQTYRPAGLVNVEAYARSYPWIRSEAQVWMGQSPRPDASSGQVVVLSASLYDPTGHAQARAGRFVLATGAVRPVHLDGGHLQLRSDQGTQLEGFGGVPVTLAHDARAFDWLVGGRLSQRLLSFGLVGASYVQQRDRGRQTNEELGADFVFYILRDLTLSGRAAYDVARRGVAETSVTSSFGSVDERVEVFGAMRNASLILPSTSLFSVLSNEASLQAGASGRMRVAPRLRLDGLAALRAQGDEAAPRLRAGGTLWLDDEQASLVEGAVTRDGVGEGQWTGMRVLLSREVWLALRVMGELEIVVPDHPRDNGKVWPWGRLSARYALLEHWTISAGAEGSSSPRFSKLFQAIARVAYEFATGSP